MLQLFKFLYAGNQQLHKWKAPSYSRGSATHKTGLNSSSLVLECMVITIAVSQSQPKIYLY